MKPFANVGDAHRKLNRSIVTYNGKLYVCGTSDMPRALVAAANLTNNMNLTPLVGTATVCPDYTENGFQVIPYELGFMNRSNLDCVYVSRLPVRHSAVGISADYIQSMGIKDKNASVINNRAIFTQDFEDMLLNKYPTFDHALDVVRKTKKNKAGVAFNKYFALFKIFDDEDEPQICLYHMNMSRLGRLNSNNKFDTNNLSRRQMLTMIAKTGIIPNEYV